MHGVETLARCHSGPIRQLFRGSVCGEFRRFAVVPSLLDRYTLPDSEPYAASCRVTRTDTRYLLIIRGVLYTIIDVV